MKVKNYTGAVPENQQGKRIDASSVKEFPSVDEAAALFSLASDRLLNINQWQDLTTEMLAQFSLYDVYGNPVNGVAREGLLVRIDIPGPGTGAAGGLDWVSIEEVKKYDSENVNSLAIRVRPADAPGGEHVTAHFYSKDSTSTFTVTRENTAVTVAIYDRDLKTNKEAANVADKVRNAVASLAGQAVFSKIQWKALAEGLIDTEPKL